MYQEGFDLFKSSQAFLTFSNSVLALQQEWQGNSYIRMTSNALYFKY